jgi:predicted deacetylase
MGTWMYEPAVAFSCDDISPKTKVTKLKVLLKIIDRHDVNVTLFVIPKSHAKWNSCSSPVKFLRDAQSCGHEIGLHGIEHLPFETGNPVTAFSSSYSWIKERLSQGLRILNEKIETNPVGFRASYYHHSKNLWKALDDLNFLYDSSRIALTAVLFSYVPPLRAIYVSRRRGLTTSKIFHPLNLKLLEIPVSEEYTWYNLKFEVDLFKNFLKNNILKMLTGCLVINSHIEALSTWGLHILRQLFVCVREAGLSSKLTLKEMAERHTGLGTAKAYYA